MVFRDQALTDRIWMRSLRHLLLCVRWDPEISPPFVYTAYGDGDRVLRATIVIAEFAIADVAQDGSLIQARSGGDLRGFEELLD